MSLFRMQCMAALVAFGFGSTFANAAEVLSLTFENASNLAEDSSSNAYGGVVEDPTGFGTISQSSNVRPGSSGTSSAQFSPDDFQSGQLITFDEANFQSFTRTDDWTVSLWINPTSTFVNDSEGFRGIVSGVANTTDTNLDWQLDNGGDGVDTLSRIQSASPLALGSELVADTWQKVTISHSGVNNALFVYLDNAVSAVASNITARVMDEIYFGANRNKTFFYEGLIDDVQVLDTVSIIDPNTGSAFELGDLDFDGDVDTDDWTAFKSGQGTDQAANAGITSYQVGDLDMNGVIGYEDFSNFKTVFNAANGPGALEAVIAAVPEPSSLLLMLGGSTLLLTRRRKRSTMEFINARETHGQKNLPTEIGNVKFNSMKLVIAALAICFAGSQAVAQTTVFSADFEAGNVAADIGTLGFTGPGAQSIVGVDHTSTTTGPDWGTQALWADRSASSGGAEGFRMQWDFTNPIDLSGATIDFDYIIRRTNTPNAKSHFVNGLDSNGEVVFSLYLIDRVDSGLENIGDYVDVGDPNGDERQRQTVAYVDPANGNTLFSTSQIASGTIPDSNGGTGGSNSFGTNLFYGNFGDPGASGVADDEAGQFTITTTSTGWSLSAIAEEDSVRDDFSTVEIPFFSATPVNLASIEVIGETVQAGGYWDNLSVMGTVVTPPDPELTLQVFSDGSMKLVAGDTGTGATDVTIDYIEITSADAGADGGSLNAAGFTGIGSDASYPLGDGSGNGWEVATGNSDTSIIESFLTGDSSIPINTEIALGSGFVPGGEEDIVFSYHKIGEADLITGIVEYITVAGLQGDFNNDGQVDAADYTVWRDNLGLDESALNGNGDGSGTVDAADYNLWVISYGNSSSSSASAAAVPEPSALALLALGFCGISVQRRRKA